MTSKEAKARQQDRIRGGNDSIYRVEQGREGNTEILYSPPFSLVEKSAHRNAKQEEERHDQLHPEDE